MPYRKGTMSVTLASDRHQPALHSFISGVGERATMDALAGLRIGSALRLRRVTRPVRGFSLEIQNASGGVLGWLPREDESALEALGILPELAEVRVAAIVPAFQRPRVRIEILVPELAEEVAPAA